MTVIVETARIDSVTAPVEDNEFGVDFRFDGELTADLGEGATALFRHNRLTERKPPELIYSPEELDDLAEAARRAADELRKRRDG